ncbi:helix-turn-helix domain-containing protein [Pseudomonas thivervalensis]|uniref:AraC family transcriptional regulator n=1 Tax=Pseudomonas thivervalensis TaxID=86265 RepID=A0A176NFB2_9PSED|nr:helix-turn-helix domain-containing protein [Pseudomonas thivervalensis]AXA54166.1 AraC family transcriptional regulator [Pseudomonas thivervalensis]AXA64082.1 AraC family transcriptional regulator [Pseudomonas thivervalensis]OAB49831.1 AraC family transcriptional regulator [Pseudomonas thivervalensis]SDF68826.1 Helix-turn-helix domain-containing protein [Pseudomonas thivervalensis]
MFAEVRTFNDPQQHAGSILGWQQVYDQLGRGCLSSELRQVCAERFQIFQEVLDKRVVQRGCAPKGRLCIAMSLGGAPVVQGHQVGAHSVVLLRDGEDFVLHAPEGTHFFAANVDTVRFAKLAAYELSSEQLKRLKSVSQVSVDEAVLQRVQQRIHPLFRHLLEQADAVNHASEKILEDVLLNAFLDLFSNASDEVRGRRGNFAVSAYLVKRCQELVVASADVPLSILDLCEQLRVSRRTLQNSFQAVTGMRPVEYLRNLRLNAVRRRLITTRAAALNVSEIAVAMGFFHLSHFAVHYRALFGESPSDTPRAPA